MADKPKDQRVPIMMSKAEIERIDRWRGRQSPIPSRSEAVRQLLAKALDDKRDPKVQEA